MEFTDLHVGQVFWYVGGEKPVLNVVTQVERNCLFGGDLLLDGDLGWVILYGMGTISKIDMVELQDDYPDFDPEELEEMVARGREYLRQRRGKE